MNLTRREFLKAAAAIGLTASEFSMVQEALAGSGDPPVIWLQGQGCSGCSVSFLNSVYYATVDELLLNSISLEYDSTLMASAGTLAMSAPSANGHILVVEGAIPTGRQKFCTIGGSMTMLDALRSFSQNASVIIAVGTCASFGGWSAGKPNPTSAVSVKSALSTLGVSTPLVNIPGCPVHPDWVVGTLSYFLINGTAPSLDSSGRPTDYFGKSIHEQCPNLSSFNSSYGSQDAHSGGKSCLSCHANTDTGMQAARMLGQSGCQYALNCKGRLTYSDCPTRGWNSPAKSTAGVNWCIGAKALCSGCTQPNYPDGMSPFYTLSGKQIKSKKKSSSNKGGSSSATVRCSDCHTGQPTGTLPAGHRAVDSSHYVTTSGGGTSDTGETNDD